MPIRYIFMSQLKKLANFACQSFHFQKITVTQNEHFVFQIYIHLGLGFYTLFVQYYSMICRPSDHTVWRPWAEKRTRDGRSRVKDSNHQTTTPPQYCTRPPHLHTRPPHLHTRPPHLHNQTTTPPHKTTTPPLYFRPQKYSKWF